jgi:TRAP-type C4-dicarboxylate transport system permease small subunit
MIFLEEILYVIKKIEIIIGVLFLAVIALLIFGDVFIRNVLISVRSPFIWTIDVVNTLFVWTVFCGSSILLKENRHLEIGFFVDKLPIFWKYLIKILVDLLILFSLFIIISATRNLLEIQKGVSLATIRFSTRIISLPVLIFSISMFFTAIVDLIKQLFNIIKR